MFLYNNVARSLHLHKGYYRWPLCKLYGPEYSCRERATAGYLECVVFSFLCELHCSLYAGERLFF